MKPRETPAGKSWLVYILRCRDTSLYTGATNNIGKRLAAHNLGMASRYTRARLPVKLLATSKPMSRGDALRLEMKIKKMPRKKKLATLLF
jgi:putative endonuclease